MDGLCEKEKIEKFFWYPFILCKQMPKADLIMAIPTFQISFQTA